MKGPQTTSSQQSSEHYINTFGLCSWCQARAAPFLVLPIIIPLPSILHCHHLLSSPSPWPSCCPSPPLPLPIPVPVPVPVPVPIPIPILSSFSFSSICCSNSHCCSNDKTRRLISALNPSSLPSLLPGLPSALPPLTLLASSSPCTTKLHISRFALCLFPRPCQSQSLNSGSALCFPLFAASTAPFIGSCSSDCAGSGISFIKSHSSDSSGSGLTIHSSDSACSGIKNHSGVKNSCSDS